MEPKPLSQRPTSYTVEEVAAIMRVSQTAVRGAIRRYLRGEKEGVIPGRKVLSVYRIPGSYVDEWLRIEAPKPAEKPRSVWA